MDCFKTIFFIVGAGRSGTTLLQSMLNAHPDISVPPESHFFRNYVVPEIRTQEDERSIPEIAETLKKDEYLKRYDIDMDTLLRPYLAGNKPFSYRHFYSSILNTFAAKKGKAIVGEKDPSYALFIKEIYAIYPSAFILHIIRDPRDVILSKSKTSWGKDRSFFSHLISYYDSFFSAREWGRKLFNQRYIEILYENLIKSPRSELDTICRAFGLAFNESMLHFYNQSSQIVSDDEIQWKKNVFKPILENNTQKWSDKLPKWKIMFIEAVCQKVFTYFGYQYSGYSGRFSKVLCNTPIFSYLLIRKIKRKFTKMG